MPPTRPRQKRSRERVEKIMLAAGEQLARTADADSLTTTSVSKSSGIPVATIYRYFADRSAIISALIDEETSAINDSVVARVNELETVSLSGLMETMIRAHFEAFTVSRRSIVLWFGARKSKEVLGRVERRYAYMGEWVMAGARRGGLVFPDTPSYGGELVVWMIDRAYEYIVREDRSDEEIERILDSTIRMIAHTADDYSTERGMNGIPLDEFWAAFGPFRPPSGPLKK
ncbi:MAG: TetR/AcrR family transcriptional regulator [Solirubrobacterales bacterium]